MYPFYLILETMTFGPQLKDAVKQNLVPSSSSTQNNYLLPQHEILSKSFI